jgi:hypothetical protein
MPGAVSLRCRRQPNAAILNFAAGVQNCPISSSSFVLVGVFWMIHQAGLERVTAFSVAGIRWNLVCLF